MVISTEMVAGGDGRLEWLPTNGHFFIAKDQHQWSPSLEWLPVANEEWLLAANGRVRLSA
jgi:hypothetical protein